MGRTIQDSLKLILEGVILESEGAELDLKNEKWCSCKNPTGFKFVKVEGHEQIWRHVSCGGLVIKPHITRSEYDPRS